MKTPATIVRIFDLPSSNNSSEVQGTEGLFSAVASFAGGGNARGLGLFDYLAASEECRSAAGPGAVCAVDAPPRVRVSTD